MHSLKKLQGSRGEPNAISGVVENLLQEMSVTVFYLALQFAIRDIPAQTSLRLA
jgi:hypothetical protein